MAYSIAGVIKYISGFFSEENGRPSHRKGISFLFCLFTLVMIVLTFASREPHLFPEVVWVSVIGGALGMSYIRSVDCKNNVNKQKD